MERYLRLSCNQFQTTSFTPLDLWITVISLIEIRVYIYVYALLPLSPPTLVFHLRCAHSTLWIAKYVHSIFLSSPPPRILATVTVVLSNLSKYISIYTNNYHVVAGYTHQIYTRTCMPQVYDYTRMSVWVLLPKKAEETNKKKIWENKMLPLAFILHTKNTFRLSICPLVNM